MQTLEESGGSGNDQTNTGISGPSRCCGASCADNWVVLLVGCCWGGCWCGDVNLPPCPPLQGSKQERSPPHPAQRAKKKINGALIPLLSHPWRRGDAKSGSCRCCCCCPHTARGSGAKEKPLGHRAALLQVQPWCWGGQHSLQNTRNSCKASSWGVSCFALSFPFVGEFGNSPCPGIKGAHVWYGPTYHLEGRLKEAACLSEKCHKRFLCSFPQLKQAWDGLPSAAEETPLCSL